MGKNILKIKKLKPVSLREFYDRKNKLLIIRMTGGLGDIFMHRMIFEDLKKTDPTMEITFALPPHYKQAVIDHPYIDKIVSCKDVDLTKYIAYNTSSVCARYESIKGAAGDKHRSDIWANHCGVELQHHNMHINLTNSEIDYGKKWVANLNTDRKPTVLLAPISAMATKNLTPHQMEHLVAKLKEIGLFVYCLHDNPIPELKDVPVATGQSIRQWMGLIAAADYVVSVDTAAFHFAGGIGKPLTGIFTWADGKLYGKYYDFVLVQRRYDEGTAPECCPCYVWPLCPLTKDALKPCLTLLSVSMILQGVEKMLNKWPIRA